MFLPIGDEPNPSQRPVVTYALIGLNVAAFFFVSLPLMAQAPDLQDPATVAYLRYLSEVAGAPIQALVGRVSAYDIFVFEHGYKPGAPGLDDLFVSLFLHGGWMHLLGNMLFLWIFGDNVEAYLGRFRYVLMYLGTGVIATLSFAAFAPGLLTPLVGASGAISGVLGCYFIWFPHNRVRILMVLFWFVDVIYVPARWVLGFYLVIENILPVLFQSSSSGVAYGAHIGGFLAGLAGAYGLDRWSRSGGARPVPGRQGPTVVRPRRWAQPDHDARDVFERAMEQGDLETAVRVYLAMPPLERSLIGADEIFTLADTLTEHAVFEPALQTLRSFIAANPRSAFLARAHLRAGLILWRGMQRPTPARQHLLTVLDLELSEDVREAARIGLAEMERF